MLARIAAWTRSVQYFVDRRGEDLEKPFDDPVR